MMGVSKISTGSRAKRIRSALNVGDFVGELKETELKDRMENNTLFDAIKKHFGTKNMDDTFKKYEEIFSKFSKSAGESPMTSDEINVVMSLFDASHKHHTHYVNALEKGYYAALPVEFWNTISGHVNTIHSMKQSPHIKQIVKNKLHFSSAHKGLFERFVDDVKKGAEDVAHVVEKGAEGAVHLVKRGWKTWRMLWKGAQRVQSIW